MKKLILIVALLLIAGPTAYAQCSVYGKVASDTYKIVLEADYVIATTPRMVYVAPIESGGFDIALPCGEPVKIGVISTRRYWWESVRVILVYNEAYHQDFIAQRKVLTETKELW